MKQLIYTLLLIAALVYAESGAKHAVLPYSEIITLIEGIKKDAIILGSGQTDVHVFVDPLCPHSRKFITRVSQNEGMLSKYKYYIYLYSIPRLKSEAAVSAIYASKTPARTLMKVMVGHEVLAAEPTGAVRSRIEEIASVARKIDVYKRPYLIVALQP